MPNQTVQSSAVNVLQCGCLGSWNTAQFVRKMSALITWSAAGIVMKLYAANAVGFVVVNYLNKHINTFTVSRNDIYDY